jgi:hypothetical protein
LNIYILIAPKIEVFHHHHHHHHNNNKNNNNNNNVISDFRRGVNEVCPLLRCYAALIGG